MRVVITDGYTLNPGDLSWKAVEEFGQVDFYDRSSETETKLRCRDAVVILTNKTPLTADIIKNATSLRLIAVTATGYNIVDIEAARQQNITVCNVPDYGTASVAQHTFALLLELANQTGPNARSVRAGDWVKSPDFCYSRGNLVELAGKTMGIIGFGKIGEQVARIAISFGMHVLYNSRSQKTTPWGEFTGVEKLFAESDVVSLHCPLTKDNNQFIDKNLIRLMKPSAWLINTARGQLINEADLADSLNSRSIAGAALDVLSKEPPLPTNPLLTADNCIITPHTAWMSAEARKRILDTTVRNIECFIKGSPINVV